MGRPATPLYERFHSKFMVGDSGCWEWMQARDKGRLWDNI